MSRAVRSLRVQLAVVGFFAIYVPVLLLAGVTAVTDTEIQVVDDGTAVEETSDRRSPWVTVTAAALGPAAAALAWWWSGRAVRPIDRVRTVAEDIEGSDLSRRIALDTGPTEVVALAASFDAMLDRLERAAEAQRRLIEEASHELRTPLTVLKANAEVMLAHPEPTVDVYREGLERSQVAATRLQTALDELLVDARGRARTIDRRPADLAAIARNVVDDAAVVATPRGITVSLAGPARHPWDWPRPADRPADRRGPRRQPHGPVTGTGRRRLCLHPPPTTLTSLTHSGSGWLSSPPGWRG